MLLKSVEQRNEEIKMIADGFHFWVYRDATAIKFEDYVDADIYFEHLVEQLQTKNVH